LPKESKQFDTKIFYGISIALCVEIQTV